MPDNPLFSFIVPVYNVEKYLSKCLTSILNQSEKNIEVILVGDPMCTDQSFTICRLFKVKYSNFTFHLSETNGAGAVRNVGLDHSKGKYICFVDGDDWIEPTLCGDTQKVLEEGGFDFVNFGFDFRNENGTFVTTRSDFKHEKMYGKDIFYNAMLDADIFTVVWNKVYRRSFLDEHQIRFPEVKVWEDVFYTRKMAYFADNTVFVPKVYYHALVRPGSFSRNISKNYLSDGLALLRYEHDFFLSLEDGSGFEDLFQAHFIKQINFFLIKAAFQVNSLKEYIDCTAVVRNSEYKVYLKNVNATNLLTIKNRVLLLPCKYPLLTFVLRIILKRFEIYPY
jgi:glycosyltransferase involved in cell wall biosynthesis